MRKERGRGTLINTCAKIQGLSVKKRRGLWTLKGISGDKLEPACGGVRRFQHRNGRQRRPWPITRDTLPLFAHREVGMHDIPLLLSTSYDARPRRVQVVRVPVRTNTRPTGETAIEWSVTCVRSLLKNSSAISERT